MGLKAVEPPSARSVVAESRAAPPCLAGLGRLWSWHGTAVPCTPGNMAAGYPVPALVCPTCFEAGGGSVVAPHLIGILYRRRWRGPSFFLRKGADGLRMARSLRDKITAKLILTRIKVMDVAAIRPSSVFERGVFLKILWVGVRPSDAILTPLMENGGCPACIL